LLNVKADVMGLATPLDNVASGHTTVIPEVQKQVFSVPARELIEQLSNTDDAERCLFICHCFWNSSQFMVACTLRWLQLNQFTASRF